MNNFIFSNSKISAFCVRRNDAEPDYVTVLGRRTKYMAYTFIDVYFYESDSYFSCNLNAVNATNTFISLFYLEINVLSRWTMDFNDHKFGGANVDKSRPIIYTCSPNNSFDYRHTGFTPKARNIPV